MMGTGTSSAWIPIMSVFVSPERSMGQPVLAKPLAPVATKGSAWDQLIDGINKLWAADYPEIPWLDKPFIIPVPAIRTARRFLIEFDPDFGGGSTTVFIQPPAPAVGVVSLPPQHCQIEYDGVARQCILEVGADFVGRVRGLCFIKPNSHTAGAVSCFFENDLKAWELFYGSQERVFQLVTRMRQMVRAFGKNAVSREQERILSVLTHLLLRRIDLAQFALERSRQPQEVPPRLACLLDRFSLTYSGHGLKRTFKFWSGAEKQSYLSFASEVIACLRELTERVALAGGIVLGFRRDGALIDWDDDIDVFAAFDCRKCSDLAQALALVESQLSSRGFKVEGNFFSHRWIRQNPHQTLDVFVGLVESDGNVAFYPSRRRGLRLETMFPSVTQQIHGVPLPLPADCDEYLRFAYGPDWRSPDRAFNDPWDRSEYADIAGARTGPIQRTRGELKRCGIL